MKLTFVVNEITVKKTSKETIWKEIDGKTHAFTSPEATSTIDNSFGGANLQLEMDSEEYLGWLKMIEGINPATLEFFGRFIEKAISAKMQQAEHHHSERMAKEEKKK